MGLNWSGNALEHATLNEKLSCANVGLFGNSCTSSTKTFLMCSSLLVLSFMTLTCFWMIWGSERDLAVGRGWEEWHLLLSSNDSVPKPCILWSFCLFCFVMIYRITTKLRSILKNKFREPVNSFHIKIHSICHCLVQIGVCIEMTRAKVCVFVCLLLNDVN